MTFSKLLCILVLAGALIVPASASLITVNFSGNVVSVDANLGSTISTGQTVSGYFVVDDSIANSLPYPNFGLYPDALVGFSAIFSGGYTATLSSPGYVSLYNDTFVDGIPGDHFTLYNDVEGTDLGSGSSAYVLTIFDNVSGIAYSSDAETQTLAPLPNFSAFELKQLSLYFLSGANYYPVVVDLNDVTVASPVPEPASYSLMGIGLLGLAGILRKRCGVKKDSPAGN